MNQLDKKIQFTKNVLRFMLIIHTIFQGVTCNNCISKVKCGPCIAESDRCAWCTQENFGKPRCDLLANLKKECNASAIVAPTGSLHKIEDKSLSDKGAREGEAIQIKPQELRIRVRPNSVQKLKVEFRQAVDYPIDLYYLMDLSNSMADDKEKLAMLGNKLAAEMKTITTNFRLGFGSFVDKTVAPYVNSHPDKLKEPCPKCAAPYGFLNNMPLSERTREFANKVANAPVSGNLDAPEGGFDALMQAIVCKEEIGWRNTSRKLLVFSTDNAFHYAGDGKLGGIISPNDGKCHLDKKGFYTKSSELDYPSLSQINRQIKDNKINMIFAVTSDQVNLYEMLSKRLTGSTTGKLESDSSNVVDLVRKHYDKLTSAVEMTDDLDGTNIGLSYYSSCLGGRKEQTNICRGLKVGKNVTFEVHLKYTLCPEDESERKQTFHIFPVGLHDQLTIHLEMMCGCECEKPENEEKFSPKCTEGNGTFECGICNCRSKRYGKECECDGSDTVPLRDVEACFNGDDQIPCSGLGKCRCGRCDCYTRANPDEKLYGTYCECNNYSCDKRDGKICSGHGVCDCGKCKCSIGWKGEDCSCRDSIETCMVANGKICSGNGECKCGVCECYTGEQEYFGPYCQDCAACSGMCDELKDCVECVIVHQKDASFNCSSCSSYTILDTDIEDMEVKGKAKPCSFEDKEKCRFTFKYAFDQDNKLMIKPEMVKKCPPPVDHVAIISGVSGGVVATGIFLLMLWKLLTVIHDRREWAKFEKERLMAKWNQGQNPLYKEVQTTYQNPAYGGTARSNEYMDNE